MNNRQLATIAQSSLVHVRCDPIGALAAVAFTTGKHFYHRKHGSEKIKDRVAMDGKEARGDGDGAQGEIAAHP